MWDTAGQERFLTALSKAYYRNASGVIFTFDITSMESFEGTQKVFESKNMQYPRNYGGNQRNGLRYVIHFSWLQK